MFPQSLQKLINQLSKLPEIGPRAATRLAFYLLSQNQEELDQLSLSLKNIKNYTHLCPRCFNIAEKGNSLCSICQNPKKNQDIICVVENILNILPIEKTGQYQGVYHVLGGLISPSEGIGPENLHIKQLIERINSKQMPISEVIFALSPTTEGDTTSLYIERLIKNNGADIKISRLARGLSTGSDLEYTDENTLANALRYRK
jgi:recombination protein RecR